VTNALGKTEVALHKLVKATSGTKHPSPVHMEVMSKKQKSLRAYQNTSSTSTIKLGIDRYIFKWTWPEMCQTNRASL